MGPGLFWPLNQLIGVDTEEIADVDCLVVAVGLSGFLLVAGVVIMS